MRIVILLATLSFASVPGPASAVISEAFTAGADGVQIHYRQSGDPGASRTLLLVPGWRISSVIWSKQLEYFGAHGYRVIAIDSRSQCGSTVVEAHNGPEDRTADLAQVITGLALQHLVVVGWSQGAQDVAAYVKRFGTHAADAFVLVDSPISGGPEDVTASPVFIQRIAQGMGAYAADPTGYSDGMMHAIISTPTNPEIFAQLDAESMKTPVDVGVSMLAQDLVTTDRRAALAAFDKPVLLVASAANPMMDAERRDAIAIAHVELALIDHAAHAVFFDQPDEFNRRLERFIDALQSPVRAP